MLYVVLIKSPKTKKWGVGKLDVVEGVIYNLKGFKPLSIFPSDRYMEARDKAMELATKDNLSLIEVS